MAGTSTTVAAAKEEAATTEVAEPEAGHGVTAAADSVASGAATTVTELATPTMPELAATVCPLWVSRFSRCNSVRMFLAL